MFRKPLFWLLFSLFAMGCALFTWHYFPKAFPMVTVDITMDRQMALKNAKDLAEQFDWGPDAPRIAASYNLDNHVQHYVELETGGAEAFGEMLKGDLYSPYTWQVRLFKEQEVNEILVRFTPQGDPYGFHEKLPEEEPGAVIPSDSARIIAEAEAAGFWSVNLDDYTLSETSENLQTGGRLDHTFVYERTDDKIADAEYRLRLTVSGDRLTELTHFINIPEGFDRRFEEMRSANETLASASSFAMILFFLLGGCGLGLFYLLKQGYIIWKQPVILSTIIAFLVMLAIFNSWPLQWMSYDTALSYQNYIIQQIITGMLAFVGLSVIFSLIFITAESLTRKAFPNHIQFWKLGSPGVVSTKQVLGITIAAFLLVCYELSYVTGTYFVTSSLFGWWYPSSALFNPDVIAEYVPWLSALAMSLQAAFWEEALFRAIPIAGAVLIGRKYGNMTLWIIAAFALQAVVFGAGHADYPQQPFYARTAELILPSIIFGLVYYFLGLYAVILIHFWYNFVWYSLSIFSATGILFDQIATVIIGLFPFWIILFQWVRTQKLGEVSDNALNKHWKPDPGQKDSVPDPEPELSDTSVFTPAFIRTITLAGMAGLIAWLILTDFGKDITAVETTRAEAVEAAKQKLNEQGIELSDDWQAFSRVYGGINMQHRFIWQNEGRESYENLLGSYLVPPLWYIRFVNFEAEVEERAEEFRVYFAGRDSLEELRHILPETSPGANLEEQEAKEIAEQALHDIHNLSPDDLELISAESSSLPERTDWTITYADPSISLKEGEARIRVRISGDEITGSNRFIHVPEEWSRVYRDSRSIPNTIQIISAILFVLVFLSGVITAVIRWTKGHFNFSTFLSVSLLITVVMAISTYNSWPITQIGFSTAQPFFSQAMTSIGFSVIGWIFVGLALGVISGFIGNWNLPVSQKIFNSSKSTLVLSIFPVLIVLGILSTASGFTPQEVPVWGNAGLAGASLPILAGTLDPVMNFISVALLLAIITGGIHHLTDGWRKRKTAAGILLFMTGFPLAGMSVVNVESWIISGILAGILLMVFYIYILRHHFPLIIPMAAFYTIMMNIDSLITPMYPGAIIAAILSVILVGGTAWLWHRQIVALHFQRT